MYIAYSALNAAPATNKQILTEHENERHLRYEAYKITCDKYSSEIAAIQKYLPGWFPKFR